MPPEGRVRRTRAGAALVGTVLTLVASCTSSGAPSPSAASAPSTSASAVGVSSTGPVTLRFAVYGDRATVAAYRALGRAYMRRKPQVTVQVESTPSATIAESRLHRQFTARDAPDLFLTRVTALPELVAKGRVQPVDDLLEQRGMQFGDSYERLGLEAFAAQSSLQCMPSDVSPYVLFYNTRLFAATRMAATEQPTLPQAGWAWTDFVRAARQMTGWGVRGVYLAPRLTTVAALVRSAGSDIVDDPRRPTTLRLADGPTRSALEQVLAVARSPRLTPTRAELTERDAVSRFEHNELGMLIGTRALVPRLRSHPQLHFEVAPLPSLGRPSTIAEVSGYCISHESAHLGNAADFLAFASSRRGAELVAESGGVVPANLAALHSPSFRQVGELPHQAGVFAAVMDRADTMPNPAAWPEVVARTQPLLDRLFASAVPNLDVLLPRIDQVSAGLLATPSATPSAGPSP